MFRIYNTLTRSIEEFKSLTPSRVGLYTCGPTVYDHMHIGNLRTFVFADLLTRVLKYNDYAVTSVQNITDIDDKIIKRAEKKNTTVETIAKEYTDLFIRDIRKLNILPVDHQPKATEYIDKMVAYIQVLIEKGFAYTEPDGSVYFAISKFPSYGKLARIHASELKTGTRILSDEYTKDNVQDFALWKSQKEGALGSYPSALGFGRPGWHIECSVMSQDLLGDTFDIHAGGIDLIFPHHENEIAQSEAKTGKKFVNYFIHGAHMLVDGKKMSKSLGNFYTLDDLEAKNLEPLALRYLYLQTHYRQEMNFTIQALNSASQALNKLKTLTSGLDQPSPLRSNGASEGQAEELEKKFLEAVNDDLNMPQALAVVWELLKLEVPSSQIAKSLARFDEVLGLGLFDKSTFEIPSEVQNLVNQREVLRKEKKFTESDEVRKQIEALGFSVEDKTSGPQIRKM